MIIELILSGLLNASPRPNGQFKAIPAKTCKQRINDIEAACDVKKSVQQCHEKIDLFYLFCGGSND